MKYAVITYIFGEHKEILREPLIVDKDVEYICVTDQKNLKSNIWKIVYDDIPEAKCTRDKMVYVKYRPFNYTDSDKVCVIDGSIEIKKSIMELFNKLDDNDLLIKLHPERDNLKDELIAWYCQRGMSKIDIAKFCYIANKNKIDITNKFLLESCVLLYKKSDKIINLCESVIAHMQLIGENRLFLSNQCILTLLLQLDNYKKDVFNQNDYFNRYLHNTNYRIKL